MKIIFATIILTIAFAFNLFSQNKIEKPSLNSKSAVYYLSYGNQFGDTIYWNYFYPSDTACIKLVIPQNSIWHIGNSTNKSYLDTVGCGATIFTDTSKYYLSNANSCFDIFIKKPTWASYLCLSQIYFNMSYRFSTDSLYDGFSMYVKYNGGSWVNWCNDITPNYIQYNLSFYANTDTIIGNIPAYSGENSSYSGCCWFGNWTLLERVSHWDNVHAFDIDSLAYRFCFNSDSVNRFHEGVQIDYIGFELSDGCNIGIENTSLNNVSLKIVPNPVINESQVLIDKPVDYFEIINIFGVSIKKIKYVKDNNVLKREWFPYPGVYVIIGHSEANILKQKIVVH